VGRPTASVPLGRPRRRWEDNVKMGLPGEAWRGMDRDDLA